MNVSSLTSAGLHNRDSMQPIPLQPLANALQSGNLSSAKVAISNIIGKLPPTGPQPPVTLDNKKATNIDWKPLAIKIYAGDITGAQQAFSQITNSMQNDSHLVGKMNLPVTGSDGVPTYINDSKQAPTGPSGIPTNNNDSLLAPIGQNGPSFFDTSATDLPLDITI